MVLLFPIPLGSILFLITCFLLDGKTKPSSNEQESQKTHPDTILNARHMHGHDNSVFSVDETLPSNGRPAQLPQHLQLSNGNGYEKSQSIQPSHNGAESSRL